MKRNPFDRDKMNMADQKRVARGTVSIFDLIQDLPKELQLLMLGCAFILMSNACGVDTKDAFAAAQNLMRDPLTQTGRAVQFQAMHYHIRTELLA